MVEEEGGGRRLPAIFFMVRIHVMVRGRRGVVATATVAATVAIECKRFAKQHIQPAERNAHKQHCGVREEGEGRH